MTALRDLALLGSPRTLPRCKGKDRLLAVLLLCGATFARPGEPAVSGTRDVLPDELVERLSHWAWQPLQEAPVPEAGDGWALDDLDRFVAAGLDRAGLRPAPDADRATWLRRVHHDLTGLPPTPEELAAFLGDGEPDAFERVVDRLLESPHYAERRAQHWLDLVRYAETKGHEFDYRIPNAFEYRDYVVRAFEADVPLDRLLVEHVAGDLLPQPRTGPDGANESLLGTGFWLLGTELHSPVDLRADRAERISDQLDTFGRAFLGMTIACARCHDHKADAIAQRDYYALAGFLRSSRRRQVRFETDAHNRALAGELQELERQHGPDLRRALADDLARGFSGSGRLLAASRRLGGPRAEVPAHLRLGEWLGRAALLSLEELGEQGAGATPLHPLRLAAGSRALGDLPARVARPAAPNEDTRVLHDAGSTWISSGPGFGSAPRSAGQLRYRGALPVGVEFAPAARYDTVWDRLERDPGSELYQAGLTWDGTGRTLQSESFELGHGRLWALARGGAQVHVSLEGHRLVAGPLHGAGKRRWQAARDARWVQLDLRDYAGLRAHVEWTPTGGEDFALLQLIEAEAPPEDAPLPAPTAADLVEAARSLAGEPSPSEAALVEWMLAWPGLASTAGTGRSDGLVVELRAARERRIAQVRWRSRLAPALIDGNSVEAAFEVRGNPHSGTEPVPRSFLAALDPEHVVASGSGRLELARRLVGEDDPLPARVWANRLWQQLFGRGIVPSVDDLGAMGEAPSPASIALLDHLALRLRAGGWSTRQLLRELCLSRSYRMASLEDPRARELDPTNDLVHHVPLRRMDAEALRDALLAFTGELDRTLYGPSIPLHLTPFLEGRGRPGKSGPVDGAGRRSLYQAVRRNFPQPFLTAFDAPTPSATRGRREVSNVPAQSLALLNDALVVEPCQRLAERIVQGDAPRRDSLVQLVEAAYSRTPSGDELLQLEAFLDAHGGSPTEAWSDLAQVLVLSAEFRLVR